MNFFQKLTGSFKIQEENSQKPKDDSEQDTAKKENGELTEDDAEKEDVKKNENPNESELEENDTTFSDSDESETTEDSFKDAETSEEELEEENDEGFLGTGDKFDYETGDKEGDDEEDGNTLSEPKQKTYTIAQLAKATVKKGVTRKRHFPSLKINKEDDASKKDELITEEPKTPEGQLAIDVYENPDEIIIKSTIAGVKPEDLDVGIEDNTVNIRGSRHNEEKVKAEDYFYQECYWGTFSRSIILPVEVDNEKATAALRDGILTIRLPRIRREKEKKIKILS